jgi:hypothetical protein
VIPGRANDLAARASRPAGGDLPHGRPLVRGAEADPLLRHLRGHLDGARNVDIAVAFLMVSGIGADEHSAARLTE